MGTIRGDGPLASANWASHGHMESGESAWANRSHSGPCHDSPTRPPAAALTASYPRSFVTKWQVTVPARPVADDAG